VKISDKIMTDSFKKSNSSLKFMQSTIPYVNNAIDYANRFSERDSMGDDVVEVGMFLH
jgi:hypothetical protein